MTINEIARNKLVRMVKGDFRGQTGVWRGITGHTDGYGAVCEINIDSVKYEFTSDFFIFIDIDIQAKWDNYEYDFYIDA